MESAAVCPCGGALTLQSILNGMRLGLGTAALLHNHILDVLLNDLLLLVVVQHGHGPQASWDTAGMQVLKWTVAPHAVVADYSGVE